MPLFIPIPRSMTESPVHSKKSRTSTNANRHGYHAIQALHNFDAYTQTHSSRPSPFPYKLSVHTAHKVPVKHIHLCSSGYNKLCRLPQSKGCQGALPALPLLVWHKLGDAVEVRRLPRGSVHILKLPRQLVRHQRARRRRRRCSGPPETACTCSQPSSCATTLAASPSTADTL